MTSTNQMLVHHIGLSISKYPYQPILVIFSESAVQADCLVIITLTKARAQLNNIAVTLLIIINAGSEIIHLN